MLLTAPEVPSGAFRINANAVWLGAVLLVVLGVKLVLIDAFGSDLPFWDQWDAEGVNLLLPYRSSGFSGIDWFAPHNGHRIALTRGLAFALLVVNGQWDAQVQAVANTALHLASAGILVRVAQRFPLPTVFRLGLVTLVVVGIASPYGWENTVEGFGSSWYFLIVTTLLLLGVASKPRLRPMDVATIALLGILADLSLAGGAMACVAAAACLLLRRTVDAHADGGRTTEYAFALLMLLAITEFALTPRTTPTNGFAGSTVKDFATAFLHGMSFPTTSGAALIWLPFVALLWTLWRHRRQRPLSREVVFVIGLGAFVALIAAGIALQRGDDSASRYTDIRWMSHFVNLAALYVVASARARAAGRWERMVPRAATVTSLFLLMANGFGALDQAKVHRRELEAGVQNVRAYVRTGDPSFLENKPPRQVPHPSSKVLEGLLSNPVVRQALPPSVRPGLLDDTDRITSTDRRSPATDPVNADPAHDARLRSVPMSSATGWLRFEVTGTGSGADTSLRLQVPTGPATIVPLPKHLSSDRWTAVVVKAPSEPFLVDVRQATPASPSWFAFRGPVEVGMLRVAADGLLRHAWSLFAVGCAALLAAAIFAGPGTSLVRLRREASGIGGSAGRDATALKRLALRSTDGHRQNAAPAVTEEDRDER